MKKYLPLLISTAVGVTTWIGIGILSGRVEAWDSNLYWSVGFPFMTIAVLIIAYVWPIKPWRWGFTVIASQAVIGLIQAFPNINLWPLSLITFFVLSLPLILAAYISSTLRKRFDDQSNA